jgi:hypothetical protein
VRIGIEHQITARRILEIEPARNWGLANYFLVEGERKLARDALHIAGIRHVHNNAGTNDLAFEDFAAVVAVESQQGGGVHALKIVDGGNDRKDEMHSVDVCDLFQRIQHEFDFALVDASARGVRRPEAVIPRLNSAVGPAPVAIDEVSVVAGKPEDEPIAADLFAEHSF